MMKKKYNMPDLNIELLLQDVLCSSTEESTTLHESTDIDFNSIFFS